MSTLFSNNLKNKICKKICSFCYKQSIWLQLKSANKRRNYYGNKLNKKQLIYNLATMLSNFSSISKEIPANLNSSFLLLPLSIKWIEIANIAVLLEQVKLHHWMISYPIKTQSWIAMNRNSMTLKCPKSIRNSKRSSPISSKKEKIFSLVLLLLNPNLRAVSQS